MSKPGVDTFVFIAHFLINYGSLVICSSYGIHQRHRCNLSTMTQISTYVVSCEGLGLAQPFVESCWGHIMFKCHQYATHDSKVCVSLNIISIKET